MSDKAVHIVFTTIFVPEVLSALRENLERHGRLDQVKVWVVGDRKTPPIAAQRAEEASVDGLETVYLDVKAQDDWGRRIPEFYARVPYDNETRRNLGYLRALEEGCGTLISIDDDNFPTEEDLVGGHLRSGRPWTGEVLSEPSGFHNVCEHLAFSPPRPVFPRGFPFRLRGMANAPQRRPAGAGSRIGVTAGLWLKEPDVDATTWLNGKVAAAGYGGPEALVLSQDTWTPINTQNTSVARELIPAFFCVTMGQEVPGGRIQRYGDIWGGYFLQALLLGTPFHVSFGRPLVEHRRNLHDYVDDLRHEFWGMILTDWLLPLLKGEFRPRASGLIDRMEELAEFLRAEAAPRLPPWCPPSVTAFLEATSENVRLWAGACRRLS